jgi:DNA-binding Lrp family transcriptional regulator
VQKQLKAIKEVKDAYISYGVYDLIVKVKADKMEDLKEIVSFKIRRLEKVRSTLTLQNNPQQHYRKHTQEAKIEEKRKSQMFSLSNTPLKYLNPTEK